MFFQIETADINNINKSQYLKMRTLFDYGPRPHSTFTVQKKRFPLRISLVIENISAKKILYGKDCKLVFIFILNHKKKKIGTNLNVQIPMGIISLVPTQNFLKNQHTIPPDTHTYVCVSGYKMCFFLFFGKFCICILNERAHEEHGCCLTHFRAIFHFHIL